jgi:hypothetical protein
MVRVLTFLFRLRFFYLVFWGPTFLGLGFFNPIFWGLDLTFTFKVRVQTNVN